MTRALSKKLFRPQLPQCSPEFRYQNWSSTAFNTEVYGQYLYGISPDVNNSKTGIDTFTRFSIANIFQVILPVTIINVNAFSTEQKVRLNWTSLTETNVASYMIERSYNGTVFSGIGAITAAGKGTQRTDYSFTDTNPLPAINYYRIKAINKDGKFVYSVIVKVNIVPQNVVIVYPNPVAKWVLLILALQNVRPAITIFFSQM